MLGIGSKDRVETTIGKIRIPEILRWKIIPSTKRYQTTPDEDIVLTERGYRLGRISQEDLERYRGDLGVLEKILGELAQNPQGFRVVDRRRNSLEDRACYSLTLGRLTEPKKLPKGEENALTRLNFYLVVYTGSYEDIGSITRSVSLRYPPARALVEIRRRTHSEFSVGISTVSVYFDGDGQRFFNPHSGVRVSISSQAKEGILQAMVCIGSTRHFTDPSLEDITTITREECEALRGYVIGFFNRRAEI